jgi:hypothetical protein
MFSSERKPTFLKKNSASHFFTDRTSQSFYAKQRVEKEHVVGRNAHRQKLPTLAAEWPEIWFTF